MASYSELVIADGASHYWRLGETSGTTAAATVGAAPGTISGGVTLNQPGAVVSNTAMTFDGASGKILTTANVPIPLAATVEAWIKLPDFATYRPLLSTRNPSDVTGAFVLATQPGGTLFAYSATDGYQVYGVRGGFADGNWHHVAFVFTGGTTLTTYLDGTLDTTGAAARPPLAGKPVSIGQDLPGLGSPLWWLGSLDEVAIYPVALTAPQVAAHYAARLTLPTVPFTLGKALMAARSGIARSGATRSGYLTNYDAVVVIDEGGYPVDMTGYVKHGSLSVTQNLNDEIDTCSLTLIPQTPTIPTVRARIRIGTGRSKPGVTEFAGQVITVRCEQFAGPDRRPFVHLTCVDDLGIFDSRLITDVWPTQSVTTTIEDIIARYTRAGFYSAVTPGLPSVDGFSVTNERPSTVLRRLTNLIGGGFLVEDRLVYAWGSAGHGGALGTAPTPLTDGLKSLKSFSRTIDGSQVRTRAYTEGIRTTAVNGLPAFPHMASIDLGSIPLEDASAFAQPPSGAKYLARIGSQVVFYATAQDIVPAGVVQLATQVTAAAAAGAAFVYVVAVPAGWPTDGWARIDNQIVSFHMDTATDMRMQAVDTAAGGTWGLLQAAVSVGASVVCLDAMYFVHGLNRDTVTSGGIYFGYAQSALRAQPQGTPVVLLRAAQDATAAGTIAGIDGSDGYLEHFIQDGRYGQALCSARAATELTNFKDVLVTYEWATDDVNAKAGKMQHIDLAEGSHRVVDDVRISSVEIAWLGEEYPAAAVVPGDPRAAGERGRVLADGAELMPITRTTWIDDDGSGTTGTIINNAEKTILYNQIDAELFAPISVGLTPANFTANNGATWAVTALSQYITAHSGKMFFISLKIQTSTITGAPTNLIITIPAGVTAGAEALGTAYITHGSTYYEMQMVLAQTTKLYLHRNALGAYSAGAMAGTITILFPTT